MSLTKADLKVFYNTLKGDDPLQNPEQDALYVPRLQHSPGGDPIQRLRRHIDLADSSSVSLLTGFRGNGKTTELHRLKHGLENDGAHVIYLDMDNYVHDTQPLDISELLLALLAALSEELSARHGLDALSESRWQRMVDFLNTDLEFSELQLSAKLPGAGARLGVKLSQEPQLKKLVRERLANHVSTLFEQANGFIVDAVSALREQTGNPDLKVAILVDSLEHIRGPINGADAVYKSILDTFSTQGERLHFNAAHLVYAVPPILSLHANSAGLNIAGKLLTMWPNIHVCDRHQDDRPDADGLAIMREVIGRRFPRWRELVPEAELDLVAWHSGGDLRDFFRMLRELLVRADLDAVAIPPFDAGQVRQVLAEFRNQLRLTLTRALSARMREIRRSKQLNTADDADYEPIMRLLDSNLVMNYQNGEPWFDIHPLLRDDIDAAEPA